MDSQRQNIKQRNTLSLWIFVIFVASGVLSSCQIPKSTSYPAAPSDEATSEERKKINETLEHISEIANKFGYKNDFNSIPVLVTSENVKVTGRIGYCQWDENRRGQYIFINRENFESDKRSSYLQNVFQVLLHEIGHCYFGRDHNPNVIKKPGYVAKVEVYDSTGGVDLFEMGFPVSIMYTGHSELCSGNCPEGSSPIGAVKDFESYFVSELLGVQQTLSADDLTKFKSFTWVMSDQQ